MIKRLDDLTPEERAIWDRFRPKGAFEIYMLIELLMLRREGIHLEFDLEWET